MPIAPSGGGAGDEGATGRRRPVAGSDIVFANGQAFNGRGYRVCGVANQRGTLCGRIGTCPFHAGRAPGAPPKRRRVAPPEQNGQLPDCVKRMDTPPTKSRFKRSWTPAEHRQFLVSMKKFGKGKWKEIAREVKTRTANQCQSHAQKYFLRQAKTDKERKKKSIHDLTEIDEEDVSTPTQQQSAFPPPPSPFHQDQHPGAQAVDALASVALATAPAMEGETRTPAERARAIGAVINAALSSVETLPSPSLKKEDVHVRDKDGNTGTVEPPDDSSTRTTSNVPTAPPPTGNEADEADEEEEEQEETELNLATDPPTFAAAVQAAANAQMQALAQAVSGTTSAPNPAASAMMSALIQNPQALMLLNPLLANMSPSGGGAPVLSAPSQQRLRVTVHVNGRKGGGMAMMLPSSNSMDEFFAGAKATLAYDGLFRRVFTRSGGEITSLDQMVQDDALWLSKGDEFATPS